MAATARNPAGECEPAGSDADATEVATAFEREQQARDLSIQIQRQDLEYRQSNRR